MGSGHVAVACALGLHLAACGGDARESPGGSATVDGTIDGRRFEPVDALGFVSSATSDTSSVIAVTMTEFANACAVAQASEARNESLANFAALQLLVIDSSGDVAAGGNYPIAPVRTGTAAQVTFVTTDAACEQHTVRATSGSLVMTRVDATVIAGTYSVTMDTGDELSGSFEAPTCAMPEGDEDVTRECRPL